jgi:hypothetical protein
MKHDSIEGDSYLYVFVEEGWENEEYPYFKIGIVSHNKTDNDISKSNWPKYEGHQHPVSIARRLFKLMNGNPRKLIPLMWLKFETNNSDSGKQQSKKHETKWLKEFRRKGPLISRSKTSSEWFQTTSKNLKDVVIKIINEEKEKYSVCYLHENVSVPY